MMVGRAGCRSRKSLSIVLCLRQEIESRQEVEPAMTSYSLLPVICFLLGVSTSNLPRDTISIPTGELVRKLHI